MLQIGASQPTENCAKSRTRPPDAAVDDEGIALAIAEEANAADRRLRSRPKTARKVEQGRFILPPAILIILLLLSNSHSQVILRSY